MGNINKTKIITYPGFTNEGSIIIKVDMEYLVQVQICTLKNLCSGYSDQGRIMKRANTSGKAPLTKNREHVKSFIFTTNNFYL